MKQPTLTQFKRGDSFMLTCTHKVDGVPLSVTGYDIQAQIRTGSDALVASLSATIANQTADPGRFYLEPQDDDTSAWPVGPLFCDIQFIHGGVTRSSATFIVPVSKDITQ